MAERKKIEIEKMRAALRALGDQDKDISYQLVYEAMGVESVPEKDVIRARMNEMVDHKELIRTGRGAFRYNFKYRLRKGQGYETIWRFVRAAKPGWTYSKCSLMTGQSHTHIRKYVDWLETEGYVVRAGTTESKALCFRNTEKARRAPETPYPPGKMTDPFAKERVAAATIARLMLCADPYALKTARTICESCRTLLARFEKTSAEIRNENENEEEEEC